VVEAARQSGRPLPVWPMFRAPPSEGGGHRSDVHSPRSSFAGEWGLSFGLEIKRGEPGPAVGKRPRHRSWSVDSDTRLSMSRVGSRQATQQLTGGPCPARGQIVQRARPWPPPAKVKEGGGAVLT